MRREWHTQQTPRRREWLEKLEREGIASASGFGVAAYVARRHGWTEWDRSDGRLGHLELLTDAGRAKLAEWRSQP